MRHKFKRLWCILNIIPANPALRLQPVLKGLPGDADRLEQSGVGKLIGRSSADTENSCDVIHGVCSALGPPFFVGCVSAHKTISLANSILKSPLKALCHKGFLLIRHLKSRCKAAYCRRICANRPAFRQHDSRKSNTGRYDMNHLRNGTPRS